MKRNKYIYFLNNKQITRSQMLDFIACHITNDIFKLTHDVSVDIANYDLAIVAITRMQRIAREHGQYIAVGYGCFIVVKPNV